MLLTSFLVFLLFIAIQPLMAELAGKYRWVDSPGARKRHMRETPIAGGLAIAACLPVSAYLGAWPAACTGLVLAMLMLGVMGFWDDLKPIRARYRFILQIVACTVSLFWAELAIRSLGDTFFAGNLGLGIAAVPFTVVALVGLVNATNMSDGLDGLCGGYSASALFWLVVVGLLIHADGGAAAASTELLISPALVMLAMVSAFLIFNMRYPGHRRASVFLGDSGSMMLGLVVGWLIVLAASGFGAGSLPAASALCLVFLPLLDMFSSIVRRVRAGKTPMTADRRHMHHLVKSHGLSTLRSAFVLNLMAFMIGGFGVLAWRSGMPGYLVFWALMAVFVGYYLYARYFWAAYEKVGKPGVPWRKLRARKKVGARKNVSHSH